MLEVVLKQGDWACLCNPEQRTLLNNINNISELRQQLQGLPITLKDNHRSTVKRGELLGLDVVAKRPSDKNNRLWARFSSLFTSGEAVVTIENLAKLKRAGIESVEPLFALEKRVRGVVVDSWFCYQYRAGEPCGAAGLDKIVELLHKMHAAGFRHDDPTWNNFLHANDGVLFTIDTKARPCTGAFHAAKDFVLLKRANGLSDFDIHALGNLKKTSIGYRLAMLYMWLKAGRSALRDKLRKRRPKNI